MDYWHGRSVRLRAVEMGDVDFFHTWNEDSEMARYVDRVWPPASREHVRRYVERTALHDDASDEFTWVIEDGAGVAVGTINAHHCDRRNGTFEYGIAVRHEHQRKGYASEAIMLVLRYFFEELRYQKVTVRVDSENTGSLRLHESLGFQLEGRLRRMAFGRGRFSDAMVYGMTAEEFASRQSTDAFSTHER